MHAHTRCTCIEWNRSTVLHSSEATVWDWEKRGSIYSPLFPTSAEHQCGDVAWSVWFQLRTFSSDHGSQEVEVEEEEKQNPPRWLNRRPPEGLLDSSYMWSCHGDILRDRLLLTGAALCAGFSGDQSLFYEWSVRVKCAEQESCQADVSVTCWGESGCCGCGKVSPGSVRRMTSHTFKVVCPINPQFSLCDFGDYTWLSHLFF